MMELRQWSGDEGVLAETLMDVLSQACVTGDGDGTLDDRCLSAYEDAFDCLASFGLAEQGRGPLLAPPVGQPAAGGDGRYRPCRPGERRVIFPGPYLCTMCGKEPTGWREPWGWFAAPFEVDDGTGGTTKDEAWSYCKPCDCWTAYAPIPDEPSADETAPQQQENEP